MKNNVTNLIRDAKQNYFKDKFSEHKNNSSKLWNLIKCLSNDGDVNKSRISQIIENDVVITDSTSIANIFNSLYFIDRSANDLEIGIKILKIAAPAIVPSLTRVINLCLTRKVFPRRWKIAKVSPIFKGNGSKNGKECFRPISGLPTLSKLLEKLICRSLNNFLNGNNILYKF